MFHPAVKLRYILFLICFWSGSVVVLNAQQAFRSNLRWVVQTPVNNQIRLIDSCLIVQGSVRITDAFFNLITDFEYDQYKAVITFNKSYSSALNITYRVFPQIARSVMYDSDLKLDSVQKKIYIGSRYTEPNNINILEMDGLSYNGSFYRGITFGNTQTLAINSGFNLGISGRMNNGIEITAAITDENIPIQPDGNTAQINQFDKMFIEVKKDIHKITVGDIDIQQRPESYFLNFNKKIQGLDYQTNGYLQDSAHFTTQATIALTRGQFARNIITAQENNQGPYKLRGANNELFLIVLSRTERVYINGQELQRGMDKDYTIDYNLGEVTFTNKRIITKDMRIVIEFQYADKNYFRSTMHGTALIEKKGWQGYINAYMEQDNKSQPLNYTLDQVKTNILAAAGDNEAKALVPNFSITAPDPTKVLYSIKDTVVNGVKYDSVFYWSTNKDSLLYAVNFSFVGEKNGHYVVLASGANGRVYHWVAPIGGVLQGDYEPLQKLVTPKKEHIYSAGGTMPLNRFFKLSGEMGMSNKDKNTFSDLDDEDNIGLAGKWNVDYKKEKVSALIGHEWINRKFNFIQRFRSLEFARDWNTEAYTIDQGDEHLIKGTVQFDGKYATKISSNAFIKDSLYKGFEQEVKTNFTWEKSNLFSATRFLSATHTNYQTLFLRPRMGWVHPLIGSKNFLYEIGLFHEWKRTKYDGTDTLEKQSFFWQNYYFKIFRGDSSERAFRFEYRYWIEKRPVGNTFDKANILSHTFSVAGRRKFKHIESIDYSMHYRNFWNKDTLAYQKELQHYYLGKVNIKLNLWNQFVKYNVIYEIGAGREQRTQYTYVKAPNGYGNYAWKDLNNNGFFELNEAYVSQFNYENRYIKILLNTPEYVSTNDVIWKNIVQLKFRQLFKNPKNQLGKINNMFDVELNRKIYLSKELSTGNYFNPFINTGIVASNSYLRNNVSFNKESSLWSVDHDFSMVANKNLLSNGIEGRNVKKHMISLKHRVGSMLNMRYRYENIMTEATHEFFAERNYRYITNAGGLLAGWVYNGIWRVDFNYDYRFQSNQGLQMNVTHESGLTARYSKNEKGLMELKVSYLDIHYQETLKNEQVEFSMLSGLSKGGNFIWSFSLERRLTDILNLNIVYQGRKNLNQSGFIHSLTAEVRAFF